MPDINRVGVLIEAGRTLEETIRLILCNADISEQEISRIKHQYRDFYNSNGYKYEVLFPGAVSTLEECARHANIIVISNKGSRAIEAALGRFGLRQLVCAVKAERPETPVKPDPRLFHAIQQQIPGGRHQQFLVVGDTETDLCFARNAGLRSCWATYGYGHGARCRAVGFDYTLDRIEDLPGILRHWAAP